MTSTAKVVNGNSTSNGHLGKRKKSKENKGSYLSKWLDKTMHHIQETTPSMETYESYINANLNWTPNNMQCPPNLDPYRFSMYGCASEPMSLPTLPTYYNPPPMNGYFPDCRYVQSVNKSVQVQRPRLRRRSENKAEDVTNIVNSSFNANYLNAKNFSDSQDFASLPIVTSVGDTTSNSEVNGIEKEETRRFSDPCAQELPDVAQATNGDAETGTDQSSEASRGHIESKLLTCLLDQITSLKMTNERLKKDLHETKMELQTVRQHNVLWQKGASLGASPHHSPMGSNGIVGGSYAPGMVTDVVREIREAARVREEALYARVRSMVLERNDTSGLGPIETKYSERSLEDIKSSIRASEADRRRMLDRIAKLEDELRVVRISNISNGTVENIESNGQQIVKEDAETERLRLRKELGDMRKAKAHAEEHALKLERLVTQLRSKYNGLQLSTNNGPESLPTSEPEPEQTRARRISVNSSNNSTVVFGPVTDL